jgi:DNA topoisomerase IA
MAEMDKRLKVIQKQTGGINVTMIAEKPSIATVIAHVLSNNKCKVKKYNGFSRYEFEGEFRGKKAFFTIISVFGHLYLKHFEHQTKSYEIDPHDLIDGDIKDYPADYNQKNRKDRKQHFRTSDLVDYLSYWIDGTHALVLWLDNDITGENICYQILRMIDITKTRCKIENVIRAKFSSLAPQDIFTW